MRGKAVELAIELTDQTGAASDWLLGIAGPTSLVAGAAAASLFELLNSSENLPRSSDTGWVRCVKLCSISLMAASFALSIVVTLVTTVTSTQLLSLGGGAESLKEGFSALAATPTALLEREMELEYIVVRAGFFQSLLNWLLAICLQFLVPESAERQQDLGGGSETTNNVHEIVRARQHSRLVRARRKLRLAVFCAMIGMIVMLLAFYNHHLTYFENYAQMVRRLGQLLLERYVLCEPVRALPCVAMGAFALSALLFVGAVVDSYAAEHLKPSIKDE